MKNYNRLYYTRCNGYTGYYWLTKNEPFADPKLFSFTRLARFKQ